jgi:hypothetical protein
MWWFAGAVIYAIGAFAFYALLTATARPETAAANEAYPPPSRVPSEVLRRAA